MNIGKAVPMMINKEDEAEFIGQIIDTFEDFLEQNLPELNASDSNEALLIDNKYFDLEDELRNLLRNWDVIK